MLVLSGDTHILIFMGYVLSASGCLLVDTSKTSLHIYSEELLGNYGVQPWPSYRTCKSFSVLCMILDSFFRPVYFRTYLSVLVGEYKYVLNLFFFEPLYACVHVYVKLCFLNNLLSSFDFQNNFLFFSILAKFSFFCVPFSVLPFSTKMNIKNSGFQFLYYGGNQNNILVE